jgi:trans-2,3-dihydro-3-hydroxyanthranilate isomerase
MKQVLPIFGRTFSPKQMSKVFTLPITEIDRSTPIQEVSTGLPVIIVPLKTLDAIKRVELSKEKYFKLIRIRKLKQYSSLPLKHIKRKIA